MSARVLDRNGWFEVPRNPLSRAGVFQYRGSSINAPDPNKMYGVYRAPEVLSDPAAIDSFRLVPFIIEHTMLSGTGVNKPGYITPQEKGVHGVTGDNIFFDPTDQTLYGNLKVFSPTADENLKNGVIDLSLGYHCQYVPQAGVAPDGTPYEYVQVNMRGNHIANVKDSRCDVAVLDAIDGDFVITFDAKDITKMPDRLKKRNGRAYSAIVKQITAAYGNAMQKKFPKMKFSVAAMDAADDEAVASEPGLSDVADILSDVLPAIAEINSTISDAMAPPDDGMEDEMEDVMDAAGKPVMDEKGAPKRQPVMDAATGKPKRIAKKVAPVAPVVDSKAMDEAVRVAVDKAVSPFRQKIAALESGKAVLTGIAQRDALAAKLSAHVGTFDHAEMTTQEVAAYGVKKLEIPATDGQEINAVEVWLHAKGTPAPKLISGVGMDEKSSVNSYIKGK